MVTAAKTLDVLGAFDATGQHRHRGAPVGGHVGRAKTKANTRQVKHQAQRTPEDPARVTGSPTRPAASAPSTSRCSCGAHPRRDRRVRPATRPTWWRRPRPDFDEFDRKVRDWRSFVQPDKSERRARDAEQRREGHASRTFDDLVRLDAWLDPLGGTEFLDEFTRIEQELFEADWAEARARVGDRATQRDLPRTAKQRRADALRRRWHVGRGPTAPANGPHWVLQRDDGLAHPVRRSRRHPRRPRPMHLPAAAGARPTARPRPRRPRSRSGRSVPDLR